MKPIFYALCALAGGGLAAGIAAFTGGKAEASAPAIVLAGINGAPGDGNTALDAALRRMMANAQVPVIEDMTPCALAVSAEVGTQPAGLKQLVSIVWQIHTEDGSLVAEVAQANHVTPGSLDESWGTEASLAARGARDRILPILQQTMRHCG